MGLRRLLDPVSRAVSDEPDAAAPARRRVVRYLSVTVSFALVYYAVAQAGAVVQFVGGVEAVWWPVGLAAGFLYLAGLRYWPGAVLGDFWLGFPESDPITYLQTAGNAGEVLIAAAVVRRLLGRRGTLVRPEDVAGLLVAVAAGTAFSASVGAGTLWISGEVAAGDVARTWRTWWLADTGGGVLLMPLIIAWRLRPTAIGRPGRRVVEVVALTGCLLAGTLVGFSSGHPLTYLVLPGLIWAALRFGLPGATAANVLTAVTAIGLTAHRRGPFVVSSVDDTVLGIQLFVLVSALTTLFLGAVVDARQLAAVELAAAERREAEHASLARRRIARDLHDSMSQTLFGLTLQAGAAEHLLSNGSPSGATVGPAHPALEPVRAAGRLAHGALAELRALIFELRPEALVEEGLVAALAKQGAALSGQRDVVVTVDGPDDRLPLSAATEEHLYRLAQEAMGNAASHSRATEITVLVRVTGDRLRLEVRDDGCGFDADRAYAGHLGLSSMRGRAQEIGAAFSVVSGPGTGSTVSVVLPVPAAATESGGD